MRAIIWCHFRCDSILGKLSNAVTNPCMHFGVLAVDVAGSVVGKLGSGAGVGYTCGITGTV